MPNITSDDIRRHVDEYGLATLTIPTGDYAILWVMEAALNYLVFDYGKSPRSIDSSAGRIKEILPEEGQVILSGENGKVIIYVDETQSFREAALDVSQVKFVPTEKPFELNGYKLGPLEEIPYRNGLPGSLYGGPDHMYPYPGRAPSILEKLVDIEAPVLEIANLTRDHFLARRYSN